MSNPAEYSYGEGDDFLESEVRQLTAWQTQPHSAPPQLAQWPPYRPTDGGAQYAGAHYGGAAARYDGRAYQHGYYDDGRGHYTTLANAQEHGPESALLNVRISPGLMLMAIFCLLVLIAVEGAVLVWRGRRASTPAVPPAAIPKTN